MRKICVIALSCFLICYVTEAKPRKPTPTPAPQPAPRGDLVCRTKQSDLELRDWIVGIQNQATAAIKEADAARAANEQTKVLLGQARQDADKYARQCQAAFECSQAPLSCWFHRFVRHLLWVGAAVILLLVALSVASIFVPALAPILGFLKGLWTRLWHIFRKPPPTP